MTRTRRNAVIEVPTFYIELQEVGAGPVRLAKSGKRHRGAHPRAVIHAAGRHRLAEPGAHSDARDGGVGKQKP
jgi:hypothetical protein